MAIYWTEHLKNTLEYYKRISKQNNKFIDKNHGIYFLQVEPESMVTPKAGYYCNQINAIKEFAQYCNDHNLIPYVKEHPHQFYCLYPYNSNRHWQNAKFNWVGRTTDFYNEIITCIPKIEFISLDLRFSELIENKYLN